MKSKNIKIVTVLLINDNYIFRTQKDLHSSNLITRTISNIPPPTTLKFLKGWGVGHAACTHYEQFYNNARDLYHNIIVFRREVEKETFYKKFPFPTKNTTKKHPQK